MVISLEVQALDLARKIGIYNAEAVFYIKNSILIMDNASSSRLQNLYDKYKILIQNYFPNADYSLLLANHDNNHNHDMTKFDVELLKEMLLEGAPDNG